MLRQTKLILIAPLAIAGLTLFIFIGGEAVKLLWNWLAPSIFGWRVLTFWEALGLLALCRILFGGVGGRGRAGSHVGHRACENRERFRQRIRERFGLGDSPAGAPEPKA